MDLRHQTLSCDVLIIGGGGAGARAAIAAAESGVQVILAAKGVISRSGTTPMAYPAINAALNHSGDGDTTLRHFRDLVDGGRGLADEDLAMALAEDMPDRIADLERYGVPFEREEDGRLLQIRHPGHNCARTLTLRNGGSGMMRGLRRELSKHDNITLLEDALFTILLVTDGEVRGAVGLDKRTGMPLAIQANAVILATGGYEAMWQHNDAGPDSTGDGLMLAYRAGASLIDLEMILFYPFVGCSRKGNGILLQYESLVHPDRFGGRMLDAAGNDLLGGQLPPPRDEMLRIIEEAVNAGNGGPNGGVFLDLSQCGKTRDELDALIRLYFNFPPDNLRLQGIDFDGGPIEVKPGLHYSLGGIRIHADCRTSLPGLFAAGECTGNLHGSNRLSGNALAETQAFGCRAGKNAAEYAKTSSPLAVTAWEALAEAKLAEQEARIRQLTAHGESPVSPAKGSVSPAEGFVSPAEVSVSPAEGSVSPTEIKAALRSIMDRYVGAKRTEEGLLQAASEIETLSDQLPRMRVTDGQPIFNNEICAALEVANMVDLSRLITASALFRRETRGHHIRTDHPETVPLAMHTCACAGEAISYIPVTKLN